MRKILAFVSIATLLSTSNIHASETAHRPFIGIDVQETVYTFYGVEGGSLFAGYRWQDFGFQTGYTRLLNEHWDGFVTYKSDNFYIDGLWFYPLNHELDFKALAGVGLFRTRSSDFPFLDEKAWDQDNTFALGLRLGIGVDYNFLNNFSAGLSYTIQSNPNILSGSINIFAINLKYHF